VWYDEVCFNVSCLLVALNSYVHHSRDRLSFSKSILRRFIRDCVDREAAVASPWTVKPPIAKRYGVDSVMPEETRKGVENIKKGEIDKRKKVWEEKEGPPTKKQKKMTAAQEERGESFPLPTTSITVRLMRN
jgi:bromodomain adjacent to zinc finger domain protein 1A